MDIRKCVAFSHKRTGRYPTFWDKSGLSANDPIADIRQAGYLTLMPFPPRSELELLLGKAVSRISIGTSSIHFIWWEGGGIDVSGYFDHIDSSGVCREFGEGNWVDPPSLLHRLLQRKIISLETGPETLELAFDDKQLLRFYGKTNLPENGLIMFGNDLMEDYIVF